MQLDSLTVREKVGQIIISHLDTLKGPVTLESRSLANTEGVRHIDNDLRDFFTRYPVGGFCLFAENLADEKQLTELVSDLHSLGRIRPIVCTDEEGGRVARIANSGLFPLVRISPMAEIAATGQTEKAFEAGLHIGTYLKRYGFDLDLAPVADVNSNPDNPVIGSRAFGADPEKAGDFAAEYLRGLHQAGIMGCAKHFPGHGDTSSDTHLGSVSTNKSWDELSACELIPFRKLIAAKVDMVMAAHITLPNVTGNTLPASLSYEILTAKLRRELGYDGIIITDGMGMSAISGNYPADRAAVTAFLAGADIILDPYDVPLAFDGLVRAAESGEIPPERLDDSVCRILRLKDGLSKRR